MLKSSLFLLFIVAIPSPGEADEIYVVVDTELFAVGAACNLFHIRVRIAPPHPGYQPYISFDRQDLSLLSLHWNERKSQHNWICTSGIKLPPNHPVCDFDNKAVLNISGRVAEGYLTTSESAQGLLGASLHTRVVELEEAAAFLEPWHLGVEYNFDKGQNVAADQGGGVWRRWDLPRAWTSPTSLWSLLSNGTSMNAK